MRDQGGKLRVKVGVKRPPKTAPQTLTFRMSFHIAFWWEGSEGWGKGGRLPAYAVVWEEGVLYKNLNPLPPGFSFSRYERDTVLAKNGIQVLRARDMRGGFEGEVREERGRRKG